MIWPDWAITTQLDTAAHWRIVWNAIACHQTQLPNYHVLEHLPESQRKALWDQQEFYRAFSLVNGGRVIERDLFEGID